jgi:uncharacterized small protein (DUF1192 family)
MTSAMARPRTTARTTRERDLVSRLTEAGEEALQRLGELPGGQRVVQTVNDLRTRVDDLGKRVRGVEELESRVAKLEKEVAALKRPATTRRSSPRKPAS